MTKKDYILDIPVRYAETDQMKVVHHGNYALYLEQARIQWLEDMGMSYALMEEQGVMLPVVDLSIKYGAPLHFGDRVLINIKVKKIPTVRLEFFYTVFNQNGVQVATAQITLIFMSALSRKAIRPPVNFMENFRKHHPEMF